MKFSTGLLAALTAASTAYVIPSTSAGAGFGDIDRIEHRLPRRQASSEALAALKKMAPGSAMGCNNADPQYKSECATAEDAIQPILTGLYKYGVTTTPEQAAVVAWMSYESADFKYNIHHFGAVNPGQGTRCMMGPNFVAEYAKSIPELASQVTGKSPEDILKLVLDNKYSFAAASWFYSTHCDTATKTLLKQGGLAGYTKFITECVGTTMDDKRKIAWTNALSALKVDTNKP